MSKQLKLLFIVIALSSYVTGASAHEPTFGIGPHTIYRGGIGLELEYEYGRQSNLYTEVRTRRLHFEAIYGITEDLALTLAVPQVTKTVRSGANQKSKSGIGDILVRGKWRFYRDDQFRAVNQLAIIGGVKLPTGNRSGDVRLGSGSTDFLLAFAAGRETRLWYYFADVRYRLNTSSGGRRGGNVFSYDGAFGVRPIRSEYRSPDLVMLVEINGHLEEKESVDGTKDPNSGGHVLSISPGMLLSYRNIMFKTAIKIPISQNLNGTQLRQKEEFIVGLEFHL
ncbi:MAG: transporter [Bacteroidota bacterium]